MRNENAGLNLSLSGCCDHPPAYPLLQPKARLLPLEALPGAHTTGFPMSSLN